MLWLSLLTLLACASAQVNTEVTRTIDASTSIVRIAAEIKAANLKGEYQVAFPTAEAKSISYLSVSLKGKPLPLSAPVRWVYLSYSFLSRLALTSFLSPLSLNLDSGAQQRQRDFLHGSTEQGRRGICHPQAERSADRLP